MFRNNLEEIIKQLHQHNHKIHNVFDIGANKGTWTAHYETKLPGSTFYMFEANPNLQFPNKVNKKHKWYNIVLSDDVNEIHHVENILAQIGVVFLKKNIKIKLYGNSKLLSEGNT